MNTLEKLKMLISEAMPEIDISSVTENTTLQNDLGLDSLAIMMISIVVEDEFSFEFEGNISFETVGELCDYIEKHNN
ncbi:MAG: acyl carrier protein [Clostridia bacterium]|nr:acyl carrier protein [Clostridia bacterium]